MSDDDNDDNLEEEVLKDEDDDDDDDFVDAEEGELDTSLDIVTAVTNKTNMSQLTSGTSTSQVYLDKAGNHHTKHRNPRKKTKTDWHAKFVENICGDDNAVATKQIATYNALNNDKDKHIEATGMLHTFYGLGMREDMARDVLHVGHPRWKKMVTDYENAQKGYSVVTVSKSSKNNKAVTPEMIEHLKRFTEFGVSTEFGYPCQHRDLKSYVTDPEVTSWESLHKEKYMKFEVEKVDRMMPYITFYKYMGVSCTIIANIFFFFALSLVLSSFRVAVAFTQFQFETVKRGLL